MRKKILILEAPGSARPEGYDQIFSFCPNPADSFPEDCISFSEAKQVYDSTHEALMRYLETHPFRDSFIHRGVDLLWCFKKPLFNLARHIHWYYETFKRFAAANPEAEFFFGPPDPACGNPSVPSLLSLTPFAGKPALHFPEEPLKPIAEKIPAARGMGFRIPQLSWGKISSCKIAIYSDMARAKSITASLPASGCVHYSAGYSRRIFLMALKDDFSSYQTDFRFSNQKHYRMQAEVWTKKLRQCSFLEDFKIGEVHTGRLLREKMIGLFESGLPALLFQIDQMEIFFGRSKELRTALLDEDATPEKTAFCLLARKRGVKTFVECHGALGHKSGFLPLTADAIFVWGQAQRRKLIEWGCRPERIVVSGCSKYRAYQDMNDSSVRKSVCAEFGLDSDRKIVLIALPGIERRGRHHLFENALRNFCQEILDVLRDYPAVQFILRPHPGDQYIRYLEEWLGKQKAEPKIVMIPRYDALALAKASDILIVLWSTYAVDGFAMRRPVISYQDQTAESYDEFREYEIFEPANGKDELRASINKLLRDPGLGRSALSEARFECLNEGSKPAEEIIADYLTCRTQLSESFSQTNNNIPLSAHAGTK